MFVNCKFLFLPEVCKLKQESRKGVWETRRNESISKLKPMELDFIGLKTCLITVKIKPRIIIITDIFLSWDYSKGRCLNSFKKIHIFPKKAKDEIQREKEENIGWVESGVPSISNPSINFRNECYCNVRITDDFPMDNFGKQGKTINKNIRHIFTSIKGWTVWS